MAKIKNTKTELKAQSDALARYLRFLPMLQLKKQQLQGEIALISSAIDDLESGEAEWKRSIEKWISLFATGDIPRDLVKLESVDTDTGNIAGVVIPIYKGIRVARQTPDLFDSPVWFDDAADAIYNKMEFTARRRVLEEQKRLVEEELRMTSQRVNLFEKVKIPECRENIRVIRIHLGDESTAAVARGKIAKKRGAGGAK